MSVPHLIVAHPDPAAARKQQRDVRSGALLRVAHGVFVTRAEWETATTWEQHIARAAAVQLRSPGSIVSHASAVIVHRLPWIRPVPDRVTLLVPGRATAQRTRFADKVATTGRELDTVSVDGVDVTDPATTAVDVALRYDRGRALMVADAVLRRGWPEELLAGRAAARPNVRASRRLRDVLKLASPLSESAGESITHLAMHDLGLPAPVQQQAFRDQAGLIGRVDFWFPDHGVVVEFDGLVKYRDASHRSGRSAEEVVIDEKLREDRLRAVPDVRHVVRPVWRDVMPGGRLPTMLSATGLPVARGITATLPW
ncbi:hypothetical protein [Curtobacterium luteum]|uniref:AbiEi antitoxin C-terminal domain-containing protein n=1 Tax=Curtobacterium luteum TaxID=33881 RepID=A0A175RIV9_9MICO|nr:hypothetical protein [Curtobacterium luteum]KTR03378.1 hypothetical protein NS184_14015 [Curtobacterium luteum]